jgi:hypothetical protein
MAPAGDTCQVNAETPGAVPDSFLSLPLSTQAAELRYIANWQWTAVKMQHERLMARSAALEGPPTEEAIHEYMRGVVDMDFFVTAVRRLLRAAELARGSGCDPEKTLKLPIKIFTSRWHHVITVRDELEHFDGQARRGAVSGLVPMHGGGSWKIARPGAQIDLYRAICGVIDSLAP